MDPSDAEPPSPPPAQAAFGAPEPVSDGQTRSGEPAPGGSAAASEPERDGRADGLLAPSPGGGQELGPWDALADRAAHYAARARGAGTRRTYRSAWTHFSQWCRSLGREPLSGDPDLVAMYVVRRADDGLTVSSIRVALAAIRTAHQLAGVALAHGTATPAGADDLGTRS